jgi:regulator of replication initiation timing
VEKMIEQIADEEEVSTVSAVLDGDCLKVREMDNSADTDRMHQEKEQRPQHPIDGKPNVLTSLPHQESSKIQKSVKYLDNRQEIKRLKKLVRKSNREIESLYKEVDELQVENETLKRKLEDLQTPYYSKAFELEEKDYIIDWVWCNPHDNRIYVVASKHNLIIWDPESDEEFVFRDPRVDFRTLTFSAEENTLYMILTDKEAFFETDGVPVSRVFTFDTTIPNFNDHREEIKQGKSCQKVMAHDPTRSVYTVNDFTSVYQWDLQMKKPNVCILGPQNRGTAPIQDMAVTSGKLYLLSNDVNIEVWDIATKVMVARLHHTAGYVEKILIAEQKNRLYSSASDNSISVWDTVTKKCICTLQHEATGDLMCLSSDGNRLFSRHGKGQNCIKVWDTENFECLAFKKLYARIQCFTVDADADIVYTALEGNVDIVDEIVMDI